MENVTHTLFSVALSRAGLNRFHRRATAILVLAGLAPDVDIVARARSTVVYLAHHRGLTHSFLAAPILAALTAGVIYFFCRARHPQEDFPLLSAWLLALAGVLGHLLLDFVTQYGTRLLLPFSGRWLAWDIMPVVDVYLLAMLCAGLVLPLLFRLITEEIGARRGSSRPGAIFALAFLVLWLGARDFCHRRAVATMEPYLYHGRESRRFSAYPDLINPLLWHGVIDTGPTIELAEVHLMREFDPARTSSFYIPEPSPALDTAKATYTGRVFLDFAAYPYIFVERREDGYEVVMRDLRFDYGISRHGFIARIRLDQRLQVISEAFHYHE